MNEIENPLLVNGIDISDRKLAEEELKTAHDNYQLLLDSMAEGAYGVDQNGNCTFVNKSFLRLLGYHDASELIGKQIHLLMHHSYANGSHYPASECKMLNSRTTKQKINVSDEVFWRKDGAAIPVEYWSYPIIKDDKVIGAICTFIDITERKKAEDQISKEKKLSDSIINSLPSIFYLFDTNGKFIRWNKNFETISGYRADEIREMTPDMFFEGEEKEMVAEQIKETFEKGESNVEAHFVTKDKKRIPYFLTGLLTTYEGKICLIGTGIDITERKRVEEELRIREAYLSAILENQPGLVWLKDTASKFLVVNHAFAVSSGKQSSLDLKGKTDLDIWPRELAEKYRADDAKVIRTDKSISVEELIHDKGQDKWFETFKTPVKDSNGKIIGTTGYARDITERKQAEEVIRESERLLNEAQHLAKLGNWYIDLGSGEVGWSKTLYEINKRDPKLSPPTYEELVSCYTKESWERLSRAVKKAIKDGTPYELELDIIRADGKIIQTYTYGKAIKDKSGRVIQLHGTVQDITERKKAEEAIKESEKKFRLLYNETPVMMHSINQEGELLSVSDFWLEKLGYQREEVLGRNFISFLTESSRKKAIEIFLPHFMATGHIENADYCFVKKNGEVIDCLLSAISQYDNNNNFLRSLAVITDITEHKLAEETIRKSEERYRDIVENISDLICTHDMNGKILSVNQAALKLLGYKIDALLKMNIQDILSPETKNQFSNYIAALKKDGYSQGLMKVRTFAGNERIWEYNNTLRTLGVETPVVRGLAKDITERMQIEAALRKSETNLRAIFENTNTGFLLMDTGFNIVSSNERGKELMNVAFGEKSRKENNLYKMLPYERKQIFSDHQSKVLQGGIVRYEVSYPQTDGSVVWFEINGKSVKNDRDLVIGISFSITDITERKSALDKLVKAESQIRNFARHLNQVIEEEKANIAREIHDELGQQLAGIKMGLASLKAPTLKGVMLKEETEKREKGEAKASSLQGGGYAGKIDGMMQDIDNSIQVMRKISTQLRPGILDTLGLIPSIKWLAEEFEKKAKIKCHLQLNVNEEKFEKNISTCFFRICQESLTNIFKHANASEVVINVGHDKDSLMLKISDNGKGIASEKLENPFSMGLLGMRERANIIGADLKITSKKDFGTTVQLKATI